MIFDGYKIKIDEVVIGKKVVPIFVKGGEHNPPHVHADVDKKFGLVEIKNGNLYNLMSDLVGLRRIGRKQKKFGIR